MKQCFFIFLSISFLFLTSFSLLQAGGRLSSPLLEEKTIEGASSVHWGEKDHEDPRETLWNPGRADSHAPIGVMANHTHHQGEWMVSYRYMTMAMQGNYRGDSRVSDTEAIAPKVAGGEGFMVVPTQMSMEMHMVGLMYAPTEEITLMAMIPYVMKKMDHLRRDGLRFSTATEGLGDVRVAGLFQVFNKEYQRLHLQWGVEIPTGSITESDAVPPHGSVIPTELRLPYPMQLGSGTVSLLPGVTYLGQSEMWSWGSQVTGTLRTGRNSEGYRLGHEVMGTAWAGYLWQRWLSTSFRLTGKAWGNIQGRDQRLMISPLMVPTADPTRRAGQQIDVSWGVNGYVPSGWLKGNRLAIEVGIPVYRRLAGPQLAVDWFLVAGWQFSW